MTPPPEPTDVQNRLTEFATDQGVPGAAFGLLRLGDERDDDVIETAAHGVLNVATGVEVTDDSVFQIGSISKVFTSTLMMQQVDDGNVDLDQSVAEIISDLKLSDTTAAREITVRHLLSHASGIDGDVFTDHGRGDDCVERYVRALQDAPQIFRPGTMFSYSNAAFVLAGRVLEVITDTCWDELLRERVIKPLGLEHTSTLPEEAILHRVAVGHEGDDSGPKPVDHWQLPRAVGPAGLINSTVGDVLTFAAAHLRDGVGPHGRFVSAASARAMREPQTPLPIGLHRDGHQGIGWLCDRWGDVPVYGHNGATVGQYAYLQVFPEQRIALCLLTNGSGAGALWTRLRHAVLADHGVEAPLSIFDPESAEPVAADLLESYTGHYGSFAENLDVAFEDDALTITVSDTADGLDPDKTPEVLHLEAAGDDGLFSHLPTDAIAVTPVRFGTFTPEQSREAGDYVYVGSRLNRRRG